MQILRSLLNSGVFMVLLVVGVSVYLAYSEQIHSKLGDIDISANFLNNNTPSEAPVTVVAEDRGQVSTSVAVAPVESSVSTTAPVSAVPISDQPIVAPAALDVPVAATVDQSAPINWPSQSFTSPMQPMAELPPMPEMPPMQPMAELPPMPEMQPMQPMAELPPMPEMQPMQPMAALPPMPEMQPMQPMAALPPMPEMQSSPSLQQMTPSVVQMPEEKVSALDEARQAYISGNFNLAEEKYRAILAKSEDPDAYGELGNVFFARQQFDQANDAYLKAAEGLIAQNRLLQAQYVIGILMQSQPDYAQKAMLAFNAKLQTN